MNDPYDAPLAIPYRVTTKLPDKTVIIGNLKYVPAFDTPEVFVDNMYKRWGRGIWCHLYSSDVELLHVFAKKIGLKREWFQDKNPMFPHYDVTKTKRKLAVDRGALEITVQDMVRLKNYYGKLKNV